MNSSITFLLLIIAMVAPCCLMAEDRLISQENELARELVEVMNVRQEFFNQLQVSFEENSKWLEKSEANAAIIASIKDAFVEMKECVEKNINWNDYANAVVIEYEKFFSKDELVALLSFYKSPLGQKLLSADNNLKKSISKVNEVQLDKVRSKLKEIVDRHIHP